MGTYQIIDQTSDSPVVSIAMLAYKHSMFIEEAIESVLKQKVNFPIQLVIAEDYSPDNTRDIVLAYQKKYPGSIKLLLQDKNVGAKQNNADLLVNLDGKYVAALEGDDFWIDENKLQKQVDFLDQNADCSMVFHNAVIRDEHSKQERLFNTIPTGYYNGNDFLKNWIVPTASVIVRKEVIDYLAQLDRSKMMYEDILFFLTTTKFGKAYYISESPWSFYRRHEGGMSYSSKRSYEFLQGYLEQYKCINKLFDYKYNYQIRVHQYDIRYKMCKFGLKKFKPHYFIINLFVILFGYLDVMILESVKNITPKIKKLFSK